MLNMWSENSSKSLMRRNGSKFISRAYPTGDKVLFKYFIWSNFILPDMKILASTQHESFLFLVPFKDIAGIFTKTTITNVTTSTTLIETTTSTMITKKLEWCNLAGILNWNFISYWSRNRYLIFQKRHLANIKSEILLRKTRSYWESASLYGSWWRQQFHPRTTKELQYTRL